MRIKLSTLHGPAAREWYFFDRYPVRIGRKFDNDVSIADPSVSRYHCELTLRDGALWVVDLGSANGVSINGRRAVEQQIFPGDELSVGLVRFRIDSGDAPPEAAGDGAPSVNLSRMHTVVLDPAEVPWLPQAAPGAGRAERDLRVLLELCRALQARLPVQEIAQRLLDLLERALPFLCGTVVLADPATARPIEIARLPADHSVRLDPSAGLSGQARLSKDSLTAPLMVNCKIIGAVCVAANGTADLDHRHLHLAAAAAATAAAAIDNARRDQLLSMRVSLLEQERSSSAELAGSSAQAQAIRRGIDDIAASAAPALIIGPTGVGKYPAARAIHARSGFAEGPLVAGRCLGRSPEELGRLIFGVESTEGFTPGWFDQAEGGTLCLDRVEGLDPNLQQRVLFALEVGEFSRQGGSTVVPVRCRVLATAGESLDVAVASGDFSDRLYNRLRGLTLRMPGLRDRPADIAVMAPAVAAELAEREGNPYEGISEAALVALTLYEWPDNVRELESAIRSAGLRRLTNRIELEDLPAEVAETLNPAAPGGYHHEVRAARREIILTALEKVRGSHSAAADLLRVNRTYLHRLIRNLDLRDEIAKRFDRE